MIRRPTVFTIVAVLGLGGVLLAGLLLVAVTGESPAGRGEEVAASPAATTTTSAATSLAAPPPARVTAVPEPATPTPLPTTGPTPLPSPTPVLETGQITIGTSVEGRPLIAYRVGRGAIKVAVVGGGPLAGELLVYFQAHPAAVPAHLALWIVPTLNPDAAGAGSLVNANGVHLSRDADTGLDTCPDNDWAAGEGGPYPFSEPESRAARDFLADAWVAIFYEPAQPGVTAGGCGQYVPANQLASLLAGNSDSALSAGSLPAGHLADALAGSGAATAVLPPAEFEQALAGVQAALAAVGDIAAAEATANSATFTWLDSSNTGVWRFPAGTFIHPLALEVSGERAYLLDGGRVLALDLAVPDLPRPLLAGGDVVDGVRVMEPLDLALDDDSLLALDRAADVYGYDPAGNTWRLDRYNRPVSQTSAHYYLALAAAAGSHYLLETNYEMVVRYTAGQPDFAWLLPESHQVDVSAVGEEVYVLSQALDFPLASLVHYNNGATVDDFQPAVAMTRPRQVQATSRAVYVLDRDGYRLLALAPGSGVLLAIYQLANRQPISAFWADPAGEQLILAGPDTLYFYGQPGRQAVVSGPAPAPDPQIHDPVFLAGLHGLIPPVAGAAVTGRDNQMPGAPRHYRLGIHEGVDFYWGPGTPVRVVADGVVVRADVDYATPADIIFDYWRSQTQQLGYTSPEAQDFYRGRQVWIAHPNGLVSHYAHLGAIDPAIVEGVAVVQGQTIGAVGNSGSILSVNSETADAHLHFELWLGQYYLGQFLRPVELREWLEGIFR
ncbi:MAG: peptidoglycan DD-metalloendopeptidase family protein [Chloroflexi bacterium]|nr:peptidoglycan DD-metalloendopeptidase family protein [Chloroflexota bacterium]MCI0577611.1 peptidoglycan DD-metalloendopeptidase family protein [Chloroflexota bacterium]MCI0644169.1 peptidoglycan DD-metalloendopeptidase family protein [Chloroflexota bacterium]MCI0725248.1 peptidoglycan DD-metalloendopeptidase family protein [Chloroflexota bacterium]